MYSVKTWNFVTNTPQPAVLQKSRHILSFSLPLSYLHFSQLILFILFSVNLVRRQPKSKDLKTQEQGSNLQDSMLSCSNVLYDSLAITLIFMAFILKQTFVTLEMSEFFVLQAQTPHSIANLYKMLYCNTHLPQPQAIVLGQLHRSRLCRVMLPHKYVISTQSFNTTFF